MKKYTLLLVWPLLLAAFAVSLVAPGPVFAQTPTVSGGAGGASGGGVGTSTPIPVCPAGYTCTRISSICPSGFSCTVIIPQPAGCPADYICRSMVPTTPSTGTSGGGGSTGTACYTFETNLMFGSIGADVAALQRFLISKGFNIPGTSNGPVERRRFGPMTTEALKKYQASVGIPATGFFGPLTRARVNVDCGTGSPVVTPTITSTSTQPNIPETPTVPVTNTITVVSPNGGQAWALGSIQTITWRTAETFSFGNPTAFTIALEAAIECVTAPCVGQGYPIASGQNNVTAYRWTVGKTSNSIPVPVGSYRVRVCMRSAVDRSEKCDYSNSSFRVTASTVVPTLPSTPTPTPTATASPTATPTQTSVPLETSNPLPTTSPSPTSSESPSSSPSASPSAIPEATVSAVITEFSQTATLWNAFLDVIGVR
jgi:hypothetical protein